MVYAGIDLLNDSDWSQPGLLWTKGVAKVGECVHLFEQEALYILSISEYESLLHIKCLWFLDF